MHECEKRECKHLHIKFCPKCQKPYCVDCGKEWEEKCNLNHYYPWYHCTQPYTIPAVTWGEAVYSGDTYVSSGNTVLKDTDNITLTCTHK